MAFNTTLRLPWLLLLRPLSWLTLHSNRRNKEIVCNQPITNSGISERRGTYISRICLNQKFGISSDSEKLAGCLRHVTISIISTDLTLISNLIWGPRDEFTAHVWEQTHVEPQIFKFHIKLLSQIVDHEYSTGEQIKTWRRL